MIAIYLLTPLTTNVGSFIQPSTMRSPNSSLTAAASAAGVCVRASHGLDLERALHEPLVPRPSRPASSKKLFHSSTP